MNGREVFKFVSRKVPGSLAAVLDAAKLKAEDVDWLLMHQANKRIIDAVAERLQIPQEKVRRIYRCLAQQPTKRHSLSGSGLQVV